MTTRRAWLPTALAALLLTTGCTMDQDDEFQPRGPLVAEDVIRLDLRQPPTREQAGFADGRDSVIFERVGPSIDVEITLPGGLLRTDAFGVVLSEPPGGSTDGRARTIVLNRRLPDLAAVQRELLEQAPALGMDPAKINAFVDRVRPTPSDGSQGVITTVQAQPPETYVEVLYSKGLSVGDADSWVINYSFNFVDRS